MRLSGGPTGWIAGSRRTGRGPGIWSRRREPPCSGPPCAAAESRRCAPTLTRRPRSSQRQASRHQAPRWPRGSLASLPVTLTAVTDVQETVRVAQETGGHQQQAEALAEQSLLAMARGDWRQAEALADR